MEKPKILIVDDEKEFCSLLKEYFSEKGFIVECAYDGAEGIAKVKSFKPDVIVLDHRMPNLDGTDVIKNVRASCSTPILCVSAIASQEVINECMKLGANAYMIKPINLGELDQAIKSALVDRFKGDNMDCF